MNGLTLIGFQGRGINQAIWMYVAAVSVGVEGSSVQIPTGLCRGRNAHAGEGWRWLGRRGLGPLLRLRIFRAGADDVVGRR